MGKQGNALFKKTEPSAGSAGFNQYCVSCELRKGRMNPAKGVIIPGGWGKCTHPGGLCENFLRFEKISRTLRGDESRSVDEAKMEAPVQWRPGLPPEKPLSEREKKLRAELEQQITETVGKAFVVVGRALKAIQEQRLYRTTHPTFEAYTKDLWDMARAHAYRQIEAYQVYENVSNWRQNNTEIENVRNCGQIEMLPKNEAQARVLAKIKDPDEQVRVWQKAVETAPDGRVTAAHIRRTIKDLGVARIEKTTHQAKKAMRAPAERISPEFRAAFEALMEQIRAEADSGWKRTDKALVLRWLEGMHTAVRNFGE